MKIKLMVSEERYTEAAKELIEKGFEIDDNADTDNISHKNVSNTNETWFSINNPGSLYSHVLISCWASDKEEYKLAQKNNGSPDCEFGSFQVRLK